MRYFQLCAVVCQTALIAMTWPLWMARQSPPVLPMLDMALFAIDVGPILLLTLAIALVWPGQGAVLHIVVLLAAIAADQTRLQPSVVSLALLLTLSGRSSSAGALLIAQAHLCALWVWAGVHKLLSPAFTLTTFPWFITRVWPSAPETVVWHGGTVLALAEILLGLLALTSVLNGGRASRMARRLVGPCALTVHLGIASALILLAENTSMIPWNIALACSGFALFAPASKTADTRDDATSGSSTNKPRRSLPALATAGCLMLSPAGFYLDVTDAYLSHVFYTGAIISTVRCDANGMCITDSEQKQSLARFGVGFPPEQRLLKAHFQASCRPGERQILHPPVTRLHPTRDITIITCPDNTVSPGDTQ